MAVSADFRKALTKTKDAAVKAKFKEAKKARPSDGFEAPDIPKGNYILRVTAEAGVSDKGKMFVRLPWMIMKGEHAKTTHAAYYDIGSDNEDVSRIAWEGLSKAVQVLTDMGEEDLENFENWTFDDLCDVLDQIDKEAPIVRGYISPRKDNNDKRRLNTYFNELVDTETEELDVDPDELEEEAEETEEEQEEEQEEEAEEEITLSKGDEVLYKPKGKRSAVVCEVVSTNKAKETATLKEVDSPSKKYTEVAWSDCTPNEE